MSRDMFGNDLTKTDSFGTPRGGPVCGLCGQPAAPLSTTRCDRCWELERRIADAPELARKILEALGCEACEGEGWLLMDNDEHGLRIERCDLCEMFASDDDAVTYVAEALKGVKVAVKPRQS